jgi:ribose-phosphate pyrophosphokinase
VRPLLFELSAAPGLADRLIELLGAEAGELERRQFPDGESYVRLVTAVEGRSVILLCTLDRPDPKLAPLLFVAAAAREQGATGVGLVAPYLSYMRQDRQFRPGEAVTSKEFAHLLSGRFDWLVTLDPHLHRYRNLDAIYSIPAIGATATDAIADWVRGNVEEPVIIGPDEESRQWVERIASLAGARSAVLRKERSGDYSVSIDAKGLEQLGEGTPVLIDDIASSARTLIEAVRLILQQGRQPPVCAVVHPIFAGDSHERLLDSGVARVVSTNAVAHESNAIDVSTPLAEAVRSVAVARGIKGAGEAERSQGHEAEGAE